MQTNAIPRQLSGHNGAIYDSCWDNFRHEWLTAGGDGVVAAWSEMEDPNGRACLQVASSVSASGFGQPATTPPAPALIPKRTADPSPP